MTEPSAPRASLAPGLYTGTYSDGRAAVTHAARLALGPRGMMITAPDLPKPVTWAYSSLRSARSLKADTGALLITSTTDDTATLYVADPAFAAAIARLSPQLTRSGRFFSRARPWLVVLGLIAALIASLWVFDLSPAHGLARLMPQRARQAMGRQAVAAMTKGRTVCEVPAGRVALDRMAERLATGAAGQKFRIVVVDWSLMNAFAVPGGEIVLTSGLISRTDGPDEVAGVLAHEMGHGLALHPETGIVRAVGLVAIADLLFGSGSLTNLGVKLAQLGYTRAAEHEADVTALAVLKGAGVSPQGLLTFFKRVEKIEEGRPMKSIDILRTHPVTAERSALVAAAAPYPATPALSADDWAALRAICPPPKPKPAPDSK